MLFDPITLIASTTEGVTNLTNYFSLPILEIGFIISVIVIGLAVMYHFFVKKAVNGSVRAIIKK